MLAVANLLRTLRREMRIGELIRISPRICLQSWSWMLLNRRARAWLEAVQCLIMVSSPARLFWSPIMSISSDNFDDPHRESWRPPIRPRRRVLLTTSIVAAITIAGYGLATAVDRVREAAEW